MMNNGKKEYMTAVQISLELPDEYGNPAVKTEYMTITKNDNISEIVKEFQSKLQEWRQHVL